MEQRVIAITMVRDEATMLPRWLKYYGEQLGPDRLVVLDDDTRDGSTTGLDVSVLKVPDWRQVANQPDGARIGHSSTAAGLVNGLAAGLLSYADTVVYTDVDEFLLPDPGRYESLRHYLQVQEAPVVAALGLNVLHHPSVEPVLDPHRPILAQRRFVVPVPKLHKPLVKRVRAAWSPGYHGCRRSYEVDHDLWLLHLKFADEPDALRRQEHRADWFADGRGGAGSTWPLGVDELHREMAEWRASDPSSVPELRPADLDLSQVVRRRMWGERRFFMSGGGNQLESMRRGPVLRLPHRVGAPF